MNAPATRKVIYALMASLDGYFEGPNGDLSWPIITEELHTYINDLQSQVDMYLHGRRMYELMAAYWPTADQDPANPDFIHEFSRIWKQMPKLVFSHTLEQVGWNARLTQEDPADVVARLKAQPGRNIEVGGAELGAEFLRRGLIDEIWVYVTPLLLGGGRPLFPPLEQRVPLRLIETRSFASGVVLLRYEHVQEHPPAV